MFLSFCFRKSLSFTFERTVLQSTEIYVGDIFFLISSFLQIRLVISEFPGSVVWSLPLIWGKICHCFKYLFSFLCFFYWYYHVYICYTFCNRPKCIGFFFSLCLPLQYWGRSLPSILQSLMNPRRFIDFSICSTSYLLSGWSGDFKLLNVEPETKSWMRTWNIHQDISNASF